MGKTKSTRERLIDSARYLFWERGFAATSMAELLDHARVNSGSFYHFFESKEGLLRAVLQDYRQALRPVVVDPAFAKTDDPVERIFALLAGYRERILQTGCQYGCPLGSPGLGDRSREPSRAPFDCGKFSSMDWCRSRVPRTNETKVFPAHRS